MTVVGLELEPDDDGLFLPHLVVHVDDRPVRMLLDTGAARSTLVVEPGPALALGPAPAGASHGAFGSGRSPSGLASVDLRIGDLRVGPVELAVHDAGRPGAGSLLGQDVLGRFRCDYRLAAARLVLDAPPRTGLTPVHLDDSGHVHLQLGWRGRPDVANAVFDTGSSMTVVDRSFAERHPELFDHAGAGSGTDATGASVESDMATMRGPDVLGVRFPDALVAVVDLGAVNRTLERPMDLILGWTVLAAADWFVDHAARAAACRVLQPRG